MMTSHGRWSSSMTSLKLGIGTVLASLCLLLFLLPNISCHAPLQLPPLSPEMKLHLSKLSNNQQISHEAQLTTTTSEHNDHHHHDHDDHHHHCEHNAIANSPIVKQLQSEPMQLKLDPVHHAHLLSQFPDLQSEGKTVVGANPQTNDHVWRQQQQQELVNQLREQQQEQQQQEVATLSTPLRIKFYFDAIEKNGDRPTSGAIRSCYQEGQLVALGYVTVLNYPLCEQMLYPNNCWAKCTKEMVITDEKINHMKNVLIPRLKTEFESLLNVRRALSDLKLDNSDIWFLDDRRADYTVPTDLANNGILVSETDLVIMVYMRPRFAPSSKTAISGGYAFHYKNEPFYQRPVLGVLNLHPANVLDDSIGYGIMRHELMHVLVFSPLLYDKYVNETGVTREQTTKTIVRDISGYDGKHKMLNNTRIITPRVTQYVQTYFNCSNIDGADLEEFGSVSTASAHWETRIFMNEMMTASNDYMGFTTYNAFSKLSLALLEDSGWYSVRDWNKGEVMTWGRNTGCTMVDLSIPCEAWQNFMPHTGYSCSFEDIQSNYCTSDLTSVGVCNIVSYKPDLDTVYQHFRSTNLGGRSAMADYCPLIQRSNKFALSNDLDCRNPYNVKTRVEGEYFGEKSACFNSNVASRIFVRGGENQDARCYRYKCDHGRLSIVIAGITLECPEDQSRMRIRTGLPIGYAGYVDCPQDGYDLLCSDERAPDLNVADIVDPKANSAPSLASHASLMTVLLLLQTALCFVSL